VADGATGGFGLTGPDGSVRPVRSGPVPLLTDGFSGRSETVPELGAALVPGVTVALVPAGGSSDWVRSAGKTQLAVYFAESLWRARGIDLLIWITATSRASVLSGYRRAAAAMGSGPAGDAETTARALVGWLGRTASPWLVVIDDLRDAADMDGLWPEGPAGRVLITSGDPAAVAGALTLRVPVFSTCEAMSYLASRLAGTPCQRSGAMDLVHDLGGEPLALAHASAVIVSSGLSCHEYRQYFAQWRSELAPSGGAVGRVTWALAAAYAEQVSPLIRGVLVLAALLDGHAIPAVVFTAQATTRFLMGAGTDPGYAWTAVRTLAQVGLLTLDTQTATVRMPRPLQAAVRAGMPTGRADTAARAAADALLEVWPSSDPQSQLADDLRSCVTSLWRAAGDSLCAAGRCHPVLMLAGQSLDDALLTGPAVSFWQEIVTVTERVLGPGNRDTPVAAARLAGALLAAGQAAEAAMWFQWVLTGRISMLGPEHPSTGRARVNLGRALVAAGRSAEAVDVLADAVTEVELVRGPDHLDTLATRDECASAYLAAGDFAEAIRLGQRSLADRVRVQGPYHPDTMAVSTRLADTYLASGKTKEAVSQARNILAYRERVLGPEHLDTLRARGQLAAVYDSAGKIGNSLQLYEQARAGYQRLLGPDHPDTLRCEAELARVYNSAGQVSEAMALLSDAIARSERALPPGGPVAQALRRSMAEITGG
jgi:tetratricopeptide (TPR) repeat protein